MSFGYSIGDFVSLLELTNRIRKRFVRAPVEFQEISEDIKKLGAVLQDIDDFESEQGLDTQQKGSIGEISQACHSVLTELEQLLDKYQELDQKMDTLGKKSRRVWKRLQWDRSRINDFRGRIDSYMILFSNVVARLNGNMMLAMKDGIDRVRQHQEDEENQAILEWLTPTDYTAQQNDILRQREEGTGQWLLEKDEFKAWTSTKQQTLFCLGIPGAGKTTLVSIIIDHLEQMNHAEPKVGLAFIYCNFRFTPNLNLQDLLASLIKQLIQRQSTLPKAVIDMYKDHRRKNTKPRTDELSSCLRSVAAELSTAFVVVDALDECGMDDGLRENFLHEIFTLQANYNVNLLATSRHIPAIMAEFDRKTWLEIRADPRDVEIYLRARLTTFPSFLLRNLDLVDEIVTRITESVDGMFLLARLHLHSLSGKSSPKAIRTALTKLHTGSDAYDHAYKDAMERIEQQGTEKRDLAKNILSWITCAKRKLKIKELLHAVAVEIDLSYFDDDNLSDMQYMISVCAGLVAVDEESDVIRLVHYTTQEYFERTWQTWFPEAHENIAMISLTYLCFEQFASGPCENWEEYRDRLQNNPLYQYAALYWGDHAKKAYPHVKGSVDRLFQCSPSFASAAQVLGLKRVFRSSVPIAHKGVSKLHLAAWFGLDDKVKELLQDHPCENVVDSKGQTALHWATRRSQAPTMELLIQEGVNADIADQYGMTALHYAALRGDSHLIRLLVRNGAQLEVTDNEGETPFLTAASQVKIASVQELLSCKTEINALNSQYQSALHLAIMAAEDDTPRVVDILLSHNICPTLCDNQNMTPLHYAVKNGDRKTVDMLLEAGVDINLGIERQFWRRSTRAERSSCLLDRTFKRTAPTGQDTAGLTPLHFAACAEAISMTEYLLSKGADPNVQCSHGDTPLHLVIRKELVDIEYEDAWTDTLWNSENLDFGYMHEEDYEDEVKRLNNTEMLKIEDLDYARMVDDLHVQIESVCSLPMIMTLYTDVIVVKLLQKGADPFKTNNKGQTALHLACKASGLKIVNRLLDGGCCITTRDAEGLTALHYAARANNLKTARLILDRYKTTAKSLCLSADKQGRTSLHHNLEAHSLSEVHMIALLLDCGADVNQADLDGNSPLSTYLRTSKQHGERGEICRFLLERGADPLWIDDHGRNLAHVAMHNQEAEVEVLELLKAYGVNLNLKDKDARSILHHGAIHGSISKEMVCFLQRNTIDEIHERDLEGKSPLMYAAEAASIKRRWLGEGETWRQSLEALKQMDNHKLV